MNSIVTIQDLYVFIRTIDEDRWNKDHRSVQKYLRALWTVANKYRFEKITGDLLAQMFMEAFQAEPAAFDAQWLEYDYAYFGWGLDEDGFFPYKYDDIAGKSFVVKRGLSDFELFRDVILCQIADMQRINVAPPPMLTQNYKSPVGINWGFYPFPTVTFYLGRGISHMYELSARDALLSCDWAELAILLEFARMASE